MQKIYLLSALYVKEMVTLEERQTEFLQKDAFTLSDEESIDDDRPYQVINGIALYSIKGKMLSEGNFFTRWFGIASYDQIGHDLGQITEDEEVEKVLIAMNTPGGAVHGISDLSDTWARLNASKPITVHTSGMLASAGVWLASNSSKIYASEVADIGSIGAVMQHISYQEALKKEGIKVTEIKSAPLKHVGSPAKDLTEEEKDHLQKQIMEADALFKKQLFQTRPQILTSAFTGATFSAAESLQMRLIDGINTFNRVFEQLSASAGSDNQHSYKEEFGMKRKVTQAMATAAVANGADHTLLEIVSQEEYDQIQAAADGADGADDGKGTGASGADAGEGTNASDGEDTPDELALATAQVEALTTELTEANASVETLTTQVTDLTAKLEQSASEPLRVIAEARIAIMRTGLGMTHIDMSAFSTDSVLAEYTALDAQFTKAYKTGGHKPAKAKGTETADGEAKPTKVTKLDNARLRAVGIK